MLNIDFKVIDKLFMYTFWLFCLTDYIDDCYIFMIFW